MLAFALEREQVLQPVVDTSHLHNDACGFAIGLPVVDIREHALRYFRLEFKPLVGVDIAFDGFVFVFLVVGDIAQMVRHVLALIDAVGGELAVEIVEVAELHLLERKDALLGEEPLAGDAVALKLEAVHLSAVEIDLLHAGLGEGSVLGHIHLAMRCPQDGAEVLLQEQVVVLPVVLLYGALAAIGFHDGEREAYAIALEAVALVEIEDEIPEELIHGGG